MTEHDLITILATAFACIIGFMSPLWISKFKQRRKKQKPPRPIDVFDLYRKQVQVYKDNVIGYSVSASYDGGAYRTIFPTIGGSDEFDVIRQNAKAMEANKVDIIVQPNISVNKVDITFQIMTQRIDKDYARWEDL